MAACQPSTTKYAGAILGQLWHVERFLVRSFLAIERMLGCVVAAAGFLATLQRDEPAPCQQLQADVLYWDKPFKIPGYRLACGIRTAAARYGPASMPCNA